MNAEEAAISRLLQGEPIKGLSPWHFKDPLHKKIWGAAEGLEEPSVALVMDRDPSLPEQKLEILSLHLPEGTQADLYNLVTESYNTRQILRVQRQFEKGEIEYEDLFAELDKYKPSKAQDQKVFATIGGAALSAIEDIDQGKSIGIPSGYPAVGNWIGTFEKGQLVVIGGYTGHGKTAFAINMALRMAEKYRVGFISLEMKSQELAFRAMSILSGIEGEDIKNKNVPASKVAGLSEAVRHLDDDLDMWIDDNPNSSMDYIEAVARANTPDILIVDHLHLLTSGTEARTSDVGNLSRRFKLLAMELDIPIIALAQLRKLDQKQNNPKPKVDDLKDSSGIQQDANKILFVYQDFKDLDTMHILVRKNRNGSIGEAQLQWEPHLTRLTDPMEVLGLSYEES